MESRAEHGDGLERTPVTDALDDAAIEIDALLDAAREANANAAAVDHPIARALERATSVACAPDVESYAVAIIRAYRPDLPVTVSNDLEPGTFVAIDARAMNDSVNGR